jgi:class 3 adenylate cyclase
MSLQKLDKKRIALLVSISNFETWWAYYSMSSGNAFQREVKEHAKQLLKNIYELSKLDPGIIDKDTIQYEEVKTGFSIKDTLAGLEDWAEGDAQVPFKTFMQSKLFFTFLLFAQRLYLSKQLGLTVPPTLVFSFDEFIHSERYLRWAPHLPRSSMYWYDVDFDESKLSKSQNIVVYGDIRRSQDLMIYTVGHEVFEQMMIRFFDTTRDLLSKNYGIFDKFTGDGFLAYFNEYICKFGNKNFTDCFVDFTKQYIEKNLSLFAEWKGHVRKLPDTEIMVSLGADLGNVYYGDRSGHLVCMGDAIVWAERMCSAAPSGEIYINNLLANAIESREDIRLSPVSGVTKQGERFKASKIEFI